MNTDQQPTSPQNHLWEQYLPSKKIQKVLLVLFIIIIGYALWKPVKNLIIKLRSNSTGATLTTTLPQPIVEQVKTPLSTDKDTDGDGLADWQETLIGTDPEIPNSQTEVPQSVRDLLSNTTTGVINTEDKLALKVYQRLLSDPKGNNIEEAVQAATAKELLDLADSVDKQQKTYTLVDLNIVEDTENSRNEYKRNLQKLLTKINPDESLLQRVYEGILKGEQLQVDLAYRILLADSITNLLNMEVPMKISGEHLTLLNTISHAYGVAESSSIRSLEKIDESMNFVYFMVFQKNINLSQDTIFIIFKMLSV